MGKELSGHVCALLVVSVWGSTFISSKVLLSHGLSPADIFYYRFLMAYVCISLFSHRKMWTAGWRDELAMVALGVLGGSLYFLTENQSLIYSTASNVSILVSTTPLLTALLTAVIYKNERLGFVQLGGSLLAFSGMALVVLNGRFILHLNPTGDMLALAASLTWTFYSLLMRKMLEKYDIRFVTRKVFGYGVLTILPYFALVEPLKCSSTLLLEPVVAGNLLFLGLGATTAGFLIWNWVMKRLGTVKSSNYIYSQCLISMLGGYLILNERITPMAIAGAVILIIGMFIAQKNNKQQKVSTCTN